MIATKSAPGPRRQKLGWGGVLAVDAVLLTASRSTSWRALTGRRSGA